MPKLKANIFDLIKAGGDVGVTSEDIWKLAYEGRRRVRLTCIKSHVAQINDLLVETDSRIVSDGRRWFLVRRRWR
jgi:hypothetical protein